MRPKAATEPTPPTTPEEVEPWLAWWMQEVLPDLMPSLRRVFGIVDNRSKQPAGLDPVPVILSAASPLFLLLLAESARRLAAEVERPDQYTYFAVPRDRVRAALESIGQRETANRLLMALPAGTRWIVLDTPHMTAAIEVPFGS